MFRATVLTDWRDANGPFGAAVFGALLLLTACVSSDDDDAAVADVVEFDDIQDADPDETRDEASDETRASGLDTAEALADLEA